MNDEHGCFHHTFRKLAIQYDHSKENSEVAPHSVPHYKGAGATAVLRQMSTGQSHAQSKLGDRKEGGKSVLKFSSWQALIFHHSN